MKGTTMALLDLQNMDSEELHGGGHGGQSTVSLLSCVSTTSVLICL
jgi:Lanthionine-containing peptide SapB precursor RamS